MKSRWCLKTPFDFCCAYILRTRPSRRYLLLDSGDGSVDAWEDTTRGDGDGSKELVEFLVILDSQSDVSWDDTSLLVVLGGVSSELKNFGSEVLKHSSQIDWGTGSYTRSDL